jgi:hypothetical protein
VPGVPSAAAIQLAIGTVGSTVQPHNLFLHSGLVLSRKVRRTSPRRVHDAIWYTRLETTFALLFSFYIKCRPAAIPTLLAPPAVLSTILYSLCSLRLACSPSARRSLTVVATNDAKFYSPPCAALPDGPFACLPSKIGVASSDDDVTACSAAQSAPDAPPTGVCGELGLLAEGYALKATLGHASLFIWALGLLAAGQASTMVCTVRDQRWNSRAEHVLTLLCSPPVLGRSLEQYAGQIIMGGCLEIRLAPWKRVALTRTLALGPALVVAVYTAPDPALFSNINEFLNVLQSIQLPFAVLPVLRFASSEPLMGIFRTRHALLVGTYAIAVFLIAVNLYLVVEFVEGLSTPLVCAAALWGAAYVFVCVKMVWG